MEVRLLHDPGWDEEIFDMVGDVLTLLRTHAVESLDALWRIDRVLYGDIGLDMEPATL